MSPYKKSTLAISQKSRSHIRHTPLVRQIHGCAVSLSLFLLVMSMQLGACLRARPQLAQTAPVSVDLK